MRNYIKLNVAVCTLFYNAGTSYVAFYACYDKPEDLLTLIAEMKLSIVLNWSGNDSIATVVKYLKLNKEDILLALNAGEWGGAQSSCAAIIWNPPPNSRIEKFTNIQSIFVDKSPRKKEGKHRG